MHSLDAKWLSRNPLPSTNRVLLQKQYEEVVPGVTAIKVGGHFEGSMVLHWEGHLFIADTFVNVPVSCFQPFPPFERDIEG
jgi:glyoxylase-like metal-dependent hydrolase (beta-lactamase superfamily II)